MIMDYEKKYKEAMARLELVTRTGLELDPTYIFPELKESEDERIRKELLSFIQNWKDPENIYGDAKSRPMFTKNENQCDKYITWLEKQGDNSNWRNGDVIRHGAILALVIGGRRVMKIDGEKITIQYPDEWVKAQDKEREYFFEKLIEKQSEQKSDWSEEDEEVVNNIIDYMKPMPIFFESTKGKSDKEYTKEFVKGAIKWLKSIKERMKGE